MPNPAIERLIADRLPFGLEHPGDPDNNRPPFTVALPGLRSTGVPTEMSTQFAEEAGLPSNDAPQLIAQAIVNLIETDGNSTIITNAELAELRAAAAAAPSNARIIHVYDRADAQRKNPLFDLTVTNRDYATVPAHLLAQRFATLGDA